MFEDRRGERAIGTYITLTRRGMIPIKESAKGLRFRDEAQLVSWSRFRLNIKYMRRINEDAEHIIEQSTRTSAGTIDRMLKSQLNALINYPKLLYYSALTYCSLYPT